MELPPTAKDPIKADSEDFAVSEQSVSSQETVGTSTTGAATAAEERQRTSTNTVRFFAWRRRRGERREGLASEQARRVRIHRCE